MRNSIIGIIVLVFIAIAGVVYLAPNKNKISVSSFEECASLGNPIMESYPRQCRYDGQTFSENIGNELDKTNLIVVDTPRPNQTISSPLVIKGKARGSWFFEASFPVILTNWDGLIIASGVANAGEGWMTAEFVPFTAELQFKNPDYKNNGTLILKKDNPSGLPENDDALEIPILFEKINNPAGILPFKSGVSGKVLLGPICPVVQNPADSKCDDKPYQTTVSIRRLDSSSIFASLKSDENGIFKFSLPPGSYVVIAEGGEKLPRCTEASVIVLPDEYKTVVISCDTGIR